VPLRIRPASDRVRHVTPLAAVFGGIRDTVVTPLGSVHLLLLGAAAHYADGRPPYSRELGAVLRGGPSSWHSPLRSRWPDRKRSFDSSALARHRGDLETAAEGVDPVDHVCQPGSAWGCRRIEAGAVVLDREIEAAVGG
jgi:hypothetical protein